MNRRLTFIVAGAIVALATLWTVRSWRLAAATRAAIGETELEIASLRGELARLPAKGAAAASTESKPKRTTVTAVETVAERVQRAKDASQKETEAREAALSGSPSLQLLFEDSRRSMYSNQFAALFRRRQLTPDQQKALIDALVAWDMKMRDLNAAMKAQGLGRNDAAVKAQRSEASADVERAAKAVLGPDALAITQEYGRLGNARTYVAAYGGLLSRVGQALTFDQFERLTAAFDGISTPKQPTLSELTPTQWDQVNAKIQAILTAAQWEVYSSTTPPGQYASRIEATAKEFLDRAAR